MSAPPATTDGSAAVVAEQVVETDVPPLHLPSISVDAAAATPAKPTTSSRPPSSRESEELYIKFGPIGYAISWLSINSLHALCGAYFVVAAMVYWRLPTTRLTWHLDLYNVTLNWRKFKGIAVVHYIFAALHFAALLLFTLQIAYRVLTTEATRARHRAMSQDTVRRLARVLPFARKQGNTSPRASVSESESRTRSRSSRAMHSVYGSFARTHSMLFARKGLFGVESRHFEAVFLVREIFETALQSYQAYRMTHLLPRRELNRAYIALLVLNCWLTPVLYRFVKNKGLQRMLCILLDIFLDFVSAIGIPTYLALTYLGEYDKTLTTFPSRLWFKDSWRIFIVSESPIVLMGSGMDAFSRLLFSISLLLSMDDVKHLIRYQPHLDAPPTTSPPKETKSNDIKQEKRRFSSARLAARLGPMFQNVIKWGHRIIVAYGFAIVIVQIYAETRPRSQACEVEVRPWFVREKACALVQLSCHPNAKPRLYNGDTNDWKTVFTDLDPDSLLMIGVRHCPNVDITPQIQHFPNIFVLKFYNCTINSWPQDAVVSSQHHPKLVSIFAIRTNFPGGTIPQE
ncbi:hypothetical protein PINS_up020683 [Pythium insidiosum]|nr:hypothetical protein PINS_up020683 [Pythium insidiosum]